MSENSIPLSQTEALEARVLIERKRTLDAEMRYAQEKLVNLSSQALMVDREQDAWLASLAIKKGVGLERLKDATIDVRRACVFLKEEGSVG